MGGSRKTDKGIRLYLRLPIRIADQYQILSLHPKIFVVHLPRQKSRRWCTVEFKTREDQAEVKAALKKIQIEGKHIIIRAFKIPNSKPSRKLSQTDTEDLANLLS